MTDSPYKKVNTVSHTNTNPFSVSKLVGVRSNSNYCAEALIRQDTNPWNDFQFGPQPSISNSNVSQYQFQPSGQNEVHPQSQRNYTQGHHQEHYDTTFHHFQPQQQDVNHFNHPQASSSNSISNFNLSSIFPEINDKTQKGNSNCRNYYMNRK
jgi:hypothetical protein